MKITRLGIVRGGRISLHLDGEFVAALHPDAAHTLKEGGELSDDTLSEILNQSGYLTAKARALSLLSRRSYSSEMLFRKLAEREDQDASRRAVERMAELGLIDDEDWARRFANDLMRRKGMSASLAIRELCAKGIDRELAKEVVCEIEEDPRVAIAAIIKKKYASVMSDEKGKRRAYNGLLRLGYRHGDIGTVMRNILEDENYYDE